MLAPKRSRSDADDHVATRTMITAVTVSAQPNERMSIRPPTSTTVAVISHKMRSRTIRFTYRGRSVRMRSTRAAPARSSFAISSMRADEMVLSAESTAGEDTTDRDKSNRQNKERYGATHYRTPAMTVIGPLRRRNRSCRAASDRVRPVLLRGRYGEGPRTTLRGGWFCKPNISFSSSGSAWS